MIGSSSISAVCVGFLRHEFGQRPLYVLAILCARFFVPDRFFLVFGICDTESLSFTCSAI